MSEELEAARALVEQLGKPILRNRVGLWISGRRYWADAANVAAQLNVDAMDVAAEFIKRLPQGARYSDLNASRVIMLLDEIASGSGTSTCVLIYNLDLLLAGIDYAENQVVWRSLWHSFPYRRRALLLIVPNMAVDLLPASNELAFWQRDGRLVGAITESRK